ncbi:MAG: mannose-1-phosphate guanylyltransferase [Planctomycetes bacterium]|nr:mannose-1-phosphate guanylyltransferase [Planctomycetota bacterium]
MLHTLIMAGGGGTRFWPRSRQQKPKQFLTLVGDRSLLQQALDRIEVLTPPTRTWIITGASYCAETARQLPTLPAERIVGEPCGRDTAACIGLGAALIARDDPHGVMLVTPADHVIEPAQEFRRAVLVAEQMVNEHPDALVTFGIKPTFAATGYGYIERGAELAQRQGVPVYRVGSFREKPHVELAEEYVATGRHFWNSGIFVWRAATILRELRTNQPKLAGAVERIAAAWDTPNQDEVLTREYANLDRISIDYAVMEKAADVLMVQAPFVWDDVGSWLAIERRHPQDAHDNTVLANHLGIDTHRCVIAGDNDKLIATLGVSDLIIIQDGDAILVAHREEEGNIKKIVEELKRRRLEKYV